MSCRSEPAFALHIQRFRREEEETARCGGRAPRLDQGTLVYWFISAVVLLHIPLSTTLLDRGVVHLQDGG